MNFSVLFILKRDLLVLLRVFCVVLCAKILRKVCNTVLTPKEHEYWL